MGGDVLLELASTLLSGRVCGWGALFIEYAPRGVLMLAWNGATGAAPLGAGDDGKPIPVPGGVRCNRFPLKGLSGGLDGLDSDCGSMVVSRP